MNILLFGIHSVGKTEIGKALANYMGYEFVDLDEAFRTRLGAELARTALTENSSRRIPLQYDTLYALLRQPKNKVIAVTPIYDTNGLTPVYSMPDVITFELVDSAKSIFDRLVFKNADGIIYKDDEYKNAHMNHYLSEIKENLKWSRKAYARMRHHFDLFGRSAEDAARTMIKNHQLAGYVVPHQIKKASVLPDSKLRVRFSGGITKEYDLKTILEQNPAFPSLRRNSKLFSNFSIDENGAGIHWNEDLALSCDELWECGTRISTPFDGLLTFEEAAGFWKLREEILHVAVDEGRLVDGVDACQVGQSWLVTIEAMMRVYGGMPVSCRPNL